MVQEAYYQQGLTQYQAKSYAAAADAFSRCPGYRDADAMRLDAIYQQALAAMKAADYDQAIRLFDACPTHKDSGKQRMECVYLKGKAAYDRRDYIGAATILATIPNHREGAKLLKKAQQEACTFTVENVSGSRYGFTKRSNGYYESTNKGKNSTYAIAKVTFTTTTGQIILDCVNYAEATCDYGIISNLDTPLSMSTSADPTTKCFKKFTAKKSLEHDS
jgi:tetratricopeptide (TPR) repeat protein